MTNEMNKTTRPERLPNKAFDSEYMTEWVREVRYLADHGIRYTFVKIKPEYGIRQYKYKKTPELFAAQQAFYADVESERAYRQAERIIGEQVRMPAWVTDRETVVTNQDINALFAGVAGNADGDD